MRKQLLAPDLAVPDLAVPALVGPGSGVAAAAPAKVVAASPCAEAVATAGAVVAALSTSTHGSALVWGGKAAESAGDTNSPLYGFSSDDKGKFGCTTRRAMGYDPGNAVVRASCPGLGRAAGVDS